MDINCWIDDLFILTKFPDTRGELATSSTYFIERYFYLMSAITNKVSSRLLQLKKLPREKLREHKKQYFRLENLMTSEWLICACAGTVNGNDFNFKLILRNIGALCECEAITHLLLIFPFGPPRKISENSVNNFTECWIHIMFQVQEKC